MQLAYQEYLNKLRGCFTGKAVGGTLGMSWEGLIAEKKVTYYDPVPTTMIANDDLDLQVVWLEVLRTKGLPVNRFDLSRGWLDHARGLCDEYGVTMRNNKHGLCPPLSGSYDNKCTAGMGSVIRTEIWAALAPGDPALAVRLALEDASVDHADDGVDATAFMAALESLAYVESDFTRLFEGALAFLPQDGRVAAMLRDVVSRWQTCKDPSALRKALLRDYFAMNWTDVSINLSWILIGFLDSMEETEIPKRVSRGMCTAVSLGHDTDCTGATLGSLFGILYPDGFEERWTKPLGNQLILSCCIPGMHETETIDELCDQIADACRSVGEYYKSSTTLTDCPETHHPLRIQAVSDHMISLYRGGIASQYDKRESLISISPYTITVRYPDAVAHKPGETLQYRAVISNPTGKPVDALLHLTADDGWSITNDCQTLTGDVCEIVFSVTAPPRKKRRTCRNRIYFNITTDSGISFTTEAGLMETLPFLHREIVWDSMECPSPDVYADGDIQDWTEHFQAAPAGGHLYIFEARMSMQITEAIMIAQGSRPIKVWRDGECILRHDGTEYCPVFHRVENNAHIAVGGNWSRYIVYIAPEVHTGPNDTPFTAYAKVPDCPTPYEQRQMYDPHFGEYEDGEIFIGFAARQGYEWLHELEMRLPELK